jgi:hypothetical protein
MNADVFVDTNVLLYSIDEDPASALKRQRSQQILLDRMFARGRTETFTIRSLMVLTSIIAIVVGVWTNLLRTQHAFVHDVEELGGIVWNVDFENDGSIAPNYPAWLPAWMQPIAPRQLNYIYLTGESIRDEHVELVLQMQPLEGLNLSGSRITDRALVQLQSCKQLRSLQLFDIPTISESAISNLQSAIPNCEILR